MMQVRILTIVFGGVLFMTEAYANVVNLPAAGDMTFTVSGTERMRIDSGSYSVGVATTSPDASLTVVGTLSATAFIGDGSGLTNIAFSSVTGRLIAVLEDQKAAGNEGGTASTGAWRTRDLNTETYDPDGIVSISSNTFTPTVDGWVEWGAQAHASTEHQTRLYNVTDAAVVSYGSRARGNQSSYGQTFSYGGGAVTANKAYRLEHRVNRTQFSDGFGDSDTSWGVHNVYTRVKLYSR